MIMRVLNLNGFAALVIAALGFGVAPAAAGGCGYGWSYGCYATIPVAVYPTCSSCCGCGSNWSYGYYSSGYWGYPYAAAGVYGPRVGYRRSLRARY